MLKSPMTVELRFLVPPHLIDAARQAMSPFVIEELTDGSDKHIPASVYPHCTLTKQELKLLLSD